MSLTVKIVLLIAVNAMAHPVIGDDELGALS